MSWPILAQAFLVQGPCEPDDNYVTECFTCNPEATMSTANGMGDRKPGGRGFRAGKLGRNVQLKEKQKWSNEKLHLDNARKLRGIYFIDPEDKEFKETIKNARKKLETPVAPALPCKITKTEKNCGSGGSNKIKTKLVCILEASQSTRLRMGESLPNHHEDHIAGKGENSLQHYNLVHKFIPMPQAMKIPAAKAAVDKEWEKLEKISAWNLTKVKSNETSDR